MDYEGLLCRAVNYPNNPGRFHRVELRQEFRAELNRMGVGVWTSVLVHPGIPWSSSLRADLEQVRSIGECHRLVSRWSNTYHVIAEGLLILLQSDSQAKPDRPKHRRGKRHKYRPIPLYDGGDDGPE